MKGLMVLKLMDNHLLYKCLILLMAIGICCVMFSNVEMRNENVDDDDVLNCHLRFVLRPFSFADGLFKYMYALVFPSMESVSQIVCEQNENITLSIVKEIMSEGLLENGKKAICLGEGSELAASTLRGLGYANVVGIYQNPFLTPGGRNYMYKLDYMDNNFDFVFSNALSKIAVPALLVYEIERVLRPGGITAMIAGPRNLYSGGLIRSASHISAYLKSSDVVDVRAVGSFTLVLFKKKFDKVNAFEHYRLPEVCPSVANNKKIMNYLEPIPQMPHGNSSTAISYVPRYMNISARNRLVYINIGAGEYVHSSIQNWVKPLYPMHPRAPHVYVIDSNVSALTSYIKSPGISFIYHPGLSGSRNEVTELESYASIGEMDEQLEDEGFDFVQWFKETLSPGDFVILAMNARAVELKLLFKLYESGDICHVDELFIRCSDGADCENSVCGDCISLFESLRNSGVYVHRWFGN